MKKQRILVLYLRYLPGKIRNTIKEHLYSFRNYSKDDISFHYYNAANGLPWYLTKISYDGVIIHYTMLAARWNRDFYCSWLTTIKNLNKIQGYKVAIPQDEYAETDVLKKFFREFNVKTVFTCFSEKDFDLVYPQEETGLKYRISVFPGYIDEKTVTRFNRKKHANINREIDLGYRAREVPFWLGRHGQKKAEIGKVFKAWVERNCEISVDISMDPSDVFLGNEWYKFLFRCRTMLGCEGGASLLDSNGEVRKETDYYLSRYPSASFDEVEANCFPGQDFKIHLFSLSPRHFECVITKTCQVLLEGEYGGIFKPGIHYIEVKNDYSNISDVIELIKNNDYCKRIAENAYQDIVESGKYTYRVFSNKVIENILANIDQTVSRNKRSLLSFIISFYLLFREWFEWILVPFFFLKMHKKTVLIKIKKITLKR